MKAIEERAKEYAPDPFDDDYIIPAREGHIVNQQRKAYVAGAKDQQYVDKFLIGSLIDKACEWLRARNVLTEASLEGFRKAMEK